MDNENNKVTKQELEDMLMSLLMGKGYLNEKGKGFKEKGLKHLDAVYLELSRIKDSL